MKKRLISLLLTVVMLLSLVVVPANAALVSGTGTLTITPNVTSVKGSTSAPAEVIYTIKVTPPAEGPVGEFHFNLKAPDGMTLADAEGEQGKEGYWVNPTLSYHKIYSKEGIFETFEYTPASKYFQAAGTSASRNMTTEAEIMTIKATIAAGKIGDFTLTAENVGINKDGTDSYSVDIKTTPVTVVSALTGELPVTIAAPVKGGTPETTITGTNYTGSITWTPAIAAGGTFAANTAYTAKVELTAKTGYQFASDVNPTVAGADSVAGVKISNDGKTLTFDAKFPKTDTKTLTKLAVTAEPTAKSYTHGDNFNRAGMVVTATYDDMSTESITDYTVSYAAGSTYLKKGDTTVTLTKGGQSATVTGLTVGAKELTVPVTATNRGYESGNKEVALTVGSLSGVVGSEEVKVANTTLTGTMADEKAGENKAVTVPAISLTGKDAGNYTVRPSGAVTVTIARKNLTAAMIKLGTQHTYNGNEQGVAISSVMVMVRLTVAAASFKLKLLPAFSIPRSMA